MNEHPLAVLRRAGVKVGWNPDGLRLDNIRTLAPARRPKMLEYACQNKAELLEGLRRGIRDGLPCEGWTPDDPAIGGYSDMGKLLEAIERAIVRGLWICPELEKWVYQRECPDVRVCLHRGHQAVPEKPPEIAHKAA